MLRALIVAPAWIGDTVMAQPLFMRLKGQTMPAAEVEAYCDRLNEVLSAGGLQGELRVGLIRDDAARGDVAQVAQARGPMGDLDVHDRPLPRADAFQEVLPMQQRRVGVAAGDDLFLAFARDEGHADHGAWTQHRRQCRGLAHAHSV